MIDFLRHSLSVERCQTYVDLAKERQLDPADLYARNITYSKELYVMIGGLEVVLRNAFHRQLKEYFRKDDWMSNLQLFRKNHQDQINQAIQKLSENKNGNYKLSDLISELSFGFWTHLTDAPYEQIFWTPALRHSFQHKFGAPVRQDVEKRLRSLLKLRNKIAHLEPIVRIEPKLMQAYQSSYDLMSWICPLTAQWFDQQNSFRQIWTHNNQKEAKNDHQ